MFHTTTITVIHIHMTIQSVYPSNTSNPGIYYVLEFIIFFLNFKLLATQDDRTDIKYRHIYILKYYLC